MQAGGERHGELADGRGEDHLRSRDGNPLSRRQPLAGCDGGGTKDGATATRAKLFAEWADQSILVIGAHYAAPTAGHVKRDGAAFRFEV
jgi:hypothetical protein